MGRHWRALAAALTAALAAALVAACSGGGADHLSRAAPASAGPGSLPPSAPPAGVTPEPPAPTPRPEAPGAPTPAPEAPGASTPAPEAPGASTPAPEAPGAPVVWPRGSREPAPPALGALLTTGHARRSDGGTLAPGLLLPLVAPGRVLTPCGADIAVSGPVRRVPPAAEGGPAVLVDPGHGGREAGARAADGTREADLTMLLGREVAADLRASGVPAALTRDADVEETIGFRAALADSLGVRLAVSVHLNAVPELTGSPFPGTSTYGSVADPAGRRAAGVLYAAVRRYLDRLTPRVGRWAANRDSGALYRLGRTGRDYYGLLRRGHQTWVIVESLYLTAPREEALVRDPVVRAGLAAAIADGARRELAGRDPGSGWRVPHPRPPDPPAPPLPGRCTDPR